MYGPPGEVDWSERVVFAAWQVPMVNEVQINVPREVTKQIAIQDPDYEVIEEQTVMVQEQVPNPNYREPGIVRRIQRLLASLACCVVIREVLGF